MKKEINRFLGKLSAAIESETKESKKEDKKDFWKFFSKS